MWLSFPEAIGSFIPGRKTLPVTGLALRLSCWSGMFPSWDNVSFSGFLVFCNDGGEKREKCDEVETVAVAVSG